MYMNMYMYIPCLSCVTIELQVHIHVHVHVQLYNLIGVYTVIMYVLLCVYNVGCLLNMYNVHVDFYPIP